MKNPSSLLLALLPALGACHAYRHDVVDVVNEREPNDESRDANDVGLLRPGDRVRIYGNISDPTFDPFDGFAFHTHEPVEVEVELAWGMAFADLDLCVYEPALDEFVFCFDGPYPHTESGTFEVDGFSDFHLVVEAFAGQGPYTLYVDAYPRSAYAKAEASAPAPEAGDGAASKPDAALRFGDYRGKTAEPEPLPERLVTGRLLSIDPSTGNVHSLPLVGSAVGDTLVVAPDPASAQRASTSAP